MKRESTTLTSVELDEIRTDFSEANYSAAMSDVIYASQIRVKLELMGSTSPLSLVPYNKARMIKAHESIYGSISYS